MGLISLIARRVGNGVLLLFLVLIVNFLLLHLAPGDIADTIAGDMGGADAEVMKDIRARFGLDQPFHTQLGLYLSRVFQGDLGYSYFFQVPVTELILERLPATLLLVISAQVLAILLGTFLGVFSAQNPNGITSHFATLFALFGYAAPVFWTGILLIILFCSVFQIFPVGGMIDPQIGDGFWEQALNIMYHLVLPVTTLGVIFLALYSRVARASMLDVLGADYVRTAKAKGLSQFTVIYKHALRNALGPVITLAGIQFSSMMSGAVLVEAVFSWPGLGSLALQSIQARDTPTILGILFFASLVVITANLLTDLAHKLADPRINFSERN